MEHDASLLEQDWKSNAQASSAVQHHENSEPGVTYHVIDDSGAPSIHGEVDVVDVEMREEQEKPIAKKPLVPSTSEVINVDDELFNQGGFNRSLEHNMGLVNKMLGSNGCKQSPQRETE